MTRRDFAKLGGKALALAAVSTPLLSSCAIGPRYPEDAYFKLAPTIWVDWEKHDVPPRGIDTQTYNGAPFTAPTVSNVEEIFKRGDGSTGIRLETDLGHILAMLGPPDPPIQIGDRVTPFDIIGTEYVSDAGDPRFRTTPHVHITLYLPWFAKFFNIGHKFTSYERDWTIDNPHKYSTTGNLLTSIYQGDDSRIISLTAEAKSKFEGIGKKYPKTTLGWYINNSEHIKFFWRTLTAYAFLRDGLIEDEGLKKEVTDYLRWHSETNPGLFLHYPNYDLRHKYKMKKPDPGRDRKLADAWKDVRTAVDKKDWLEVLRTLERYGQIPHGSQKTEERFYGLAHFQLGAYDQSMPHLLTSYGMNTTRFAIRESQRREFYYWLFEDARINSQKLNFIKEAEFFKNARDNSKDWGRLS